MTFTHPDYPDVDRTAVDWTDLDGVERQATIALEYSASPEYSGTNKAEWTAAERVRSNDPYRSGTDIPPSAQQKSLPGA